MAASLKGAAPDLPELVAALPFPSNTLRLHEGTYGIRGTRKAHPAAAAAPCARLRAWRGRGDRAGHGGHAARRAGVRGPGPLDARAPRRAGRSRAAIQ